MRATGLWVVVLVALGLTTPAAAGPAAVASADRYSADAAVQVLEAGGNAIDAAVATAFVLAVTYPEAGNLGGGGFATVRFDHRNYFLDYRERAPRAATATMYLDAAGNVIPDASTVGAKAAGVPGTVEGLCQLHRRFGRLPWRTDLAAAVRYAEQGFEVDPQLVANCEDKLAQLGTRTNFGRYFGGLRAGTTHRQPELARVLRRIQRDGPRGFYRGPTAQLLLAEMRRGGGLIDAADLDAYRAVWRAPLEADWQGLRVITAPLPSSGGIALVSLLAMRVNLESAFRGVPHNSPRYIHLLAEMQKRVFADRAEYFGDPDYASAPVSELLSPAYLARRAAEVDPERPTPTASVVPGIPVHHDTTHFSIVDRDGNAVANTYTLNDDFGSGQVVEGAGFLLNNEMDDFSVKPGVPNIYGVVGADANAIAPGKRPLSSMTPTILTRGGEVELVIGTPGGSRIFGWIFQVICNWHDFGMPLADAVAAARVHHQLLPPNRLFEEPRPGLDAATVTALTALGYTFENQGWSGDLEAVEVRNGRAVAAADPRGRGAARILGAVRRSGEASGRRPAAP